MGMVSFQHFDFSVHVHSHSLIHEARNAIVKKCLDEKYDYLFFLDSDVIFQDTLLLYLLQLNKEIIGGLYFRKRHPFDPLITKFDGKEYQPMYEYPKNSTFEVDSIAMGCTLIKREVLEKMKDPHFWYEILPSGQHLGEDTYFCRKATELGYKIWCSSYTPVYHIGRQLVDEGLFEITKQARDRKVGRAN